MEIQALNQVGSVLFVLIFILRVSNSSNQKMRFLVNLRRAFKRAIAIQVLARTASAGAATSAATSILTVSDGMAEVANIVTVQARDASGTPQTAGDDTFKLKVEYQCTAVNVFDCNPVGGYDNVAGLHFETTMTYSGADGIYTGSYMITSSSGTISVGVVLESTGNLVGEYFYNDNWEGDPAIITQTETDINKNWGIGDATPLDAGYWANPRNSEQVSGKFTGRIIATTTEDYIFAPAFDNSGTLTFDDGDSVSNTFWTRNTLTKSLVAGQQYPFTLWWMSYHAGAACRMEWIIAGASQSIIPASAYKEYERVSGAPITAVIAPTSVPTMSTIETMSPSTGTAGVPFEIVLQSRQQDATVNDDPTDPDTYTVTLTKGTDTIPTYTETATLSANGKYQATLTAFLAEIYTVNVYLTNAYTATSTSIPTEVSGSDFILTIIPGEIDPVQCYTDVPATPTIVAGTSFAFNMWFVDKWGNQHTAATLESELSTAGNVVDANAVYDNHDDWSSPIGVEDIEDWKLTYGPGWDTTSGWTLQATPQVMNDGTRQGEVLIERAGAFTLGITVDGAQVKDAPFQFLQVVPDAVHTPNCIPVDIPEVMYAGIPYSFKIQGRDQFHNNIKDLLDDTSQNSAYLTFNEDDSVVLDAVDVSDDLDFPGVYQVDFDLPKDQQNGEYELKMEISGSFNIHAENITVLPCSNFEALERGLIDTIVGQTTELEDIAYQIGSDPILVGIEPIDFYCEHEPALILLSATANSSVEQLDTEGLAEHGINLSIIDGNPTVSVQTSETSLRGYSFDLTISSTVAEETDWQNTVLLKINYGQFDIETIHVSEEAPRFDIETIHVSEEAPRFDQEAAKESDESQLQMKDFVLTPVILDCSLQNWQRTLPPIIDETPDNKVTVEVNLGDAATFLSYSTFDRKFELVPEIEPQSRVQINVLVDLVNQNQKKRQYQLKVTYTCLLDEPEPPILNTIAERRFDKDAPVPFIYHISSYGEVTIKFSKEMQAGAVLSKKELYRPNSLRRLTLLDEDDDGLQVKGHPTENYKNFTLLHNSTLWINGTLYPSVQVAVEPENIDDTSCIKNLGFTWETKSFSEDKWVLQLSWEMPECVSSSTNEGDTLVVTLYDQRIFTDTDGKLVWPEVVMRKRLVRQLEPADTAAQEIGSAVAVAILAGSALVVALNPFLSLGLSQLLNAIKNLQIVVHILLIKVYLVPHAASFLKELQRVISFELWDPSEVTGQALNLVEGESIDINFEAMGYESANVIFNIGLPFFVMLFAPPVILLLFMVSRCKCCGPVSRFAQRLLDGIFFNGIITFVDGSLIVFTISCLVQIYQVREGGIPRRASYYFACTFVLCSIPYIVALTGYLCRKFPKLGESAIQKRVGAAYAGFAVHRGNRMTLGQLVFSFVRVLALSLIITFGRDSTETQRFFMNYVTLFMIGFVALVRPFALPWQNRLELFNEFTILVLYCHCVTQTDFVEDLNGRSWTGWSLIVVICFNVFVNFGFVVGQAILKLYTRLRLWYRRRQLIKEAQERRLRQIEIIRERQMKYLEDMKRAKQYSLANYYGLGKPWVSNRRKINVDENHNERVLEESQKALESNSLKVQAKVRPGGSNVQNVRNIQLKTMPGTKAKSSSKSPRKKQTVNKSAPSAYLQQTQTVFEIRNVSYK